MYFLCNGISSRLIIKGKLYCNSYDLINGVRLSLKIRRCLCNPKIQPTISMAAFGFGPSDRRRGEYPGQEN